MAKQYNWVEPEIHEKEMIAVLTKGLGRPLTDLEIRKINWFSNCEYDTRGVLLDLFKELTNK